MAKNLKLKVKNSQLASALNLKKVKKPAKKKETEEKKPTPKEAAEQQANAPKQLKAKVIRKKADIGKPEKPPEPVAPPPVEVKEEVVETKPPEPKKKELPLGPILDREPSKPAEKKTSTTSTPSKDTKLPPKKPMRDLKPGKKTTSFRPFDSRDRQGLRSEEEANRYRRRRPTRMRRPKRETEIVRPSEVTVRLPITVKDLAQEMKLKASQLIAKLFAQGVMITINDYLEDETTVQLLGEEFKCAVHIDTSEEERLKITDKSIAAEISETDDKDLVLRAPIVTFMGHVDHGKTSLIDAIRKSNIASGEAGDITQHIGAFKCHQDHGDITVLDTPGHAAFSMMRARGATVTDVVVLVIAGDEGMKPQTEEAIDHALEAGVPIVVAINKSDKEGFNPEEVYRQLSEKNLLPEAWGGSVLTVNCSATTKEGIPELLDTLALQSEMLELKANPKSRARGSVVESQLHKGLGAVATILVQTGTLKKGDALVFDEHYGRIKTMYDEHGKAVNEAGPSTPVKITGLSGVPVAGCEFIVVESEKEARKLCEERASGRSRAQLKSSKVPGLDALMERSQELEVKKVLNLILRADVQGSVEALQASLLGIKSNKVEINIVSAKVGEISESDVELAGASGARIIGFHTQVESHAESLIRQLGVKIKLHDIIYHAIDDVKEMMIDILDKVRKEDEIGTAEVKTTFKASHLGVIAGCVVKDGLIKRDAYARVFRGGEQVWQGDIASLKHVKDDISESKKGSECGILLKKYNDVQTDDVIKAYAITYITPEL